MEKEKIIENTIEKFIPTESKRKTFLTIFCETIKYAHSFGLGKWGVSIESDRIRIKVGNLITTTIHQDSIWMALDETMYIQNVNKFDNLLAEDWDKSEFPEYSAIKTKNYYYRDESLDKWNKIKELHLELIKKACEKYSQLRIDSQKNNSIDFLDYLRKECDAEIPYPQYEIPTGTEIRKEILEHLFEKFIKRVQEKDGVEFVSFATCEYLNKQEGYKKSVCRKAIELVENANWKREDIGSGKIFATVNENVQKNSVNLITNFRPKDNFRKIPVTNDFEELFYDFYHDRENFANDKIIFEKLYNEYKLNYNLIAYLFFIKQPAKYMPIAQEKFNKIFRNVLQINFIANETSWHNYTTFGQILEQVRNFLSTKDRDSTLLDAHSFLYVMQDEKIEIKIDENMEKYINLLISKKNLILTGAPGTGKTYQTAEIALRIIGKTSVDFFDRKAVMEAYEQARKDGFIRFTTFHQSLDYEEFIEGLKPDVDESNHGTGTYSVKPGIFKEICNKASLPIVTNNILNIRQNAIVWKVSLKGTGDNDVRTDCMNSNRIRIGWDEYGKEITDDMNLNVGGKNVLDSFINKMQIGDIVISCYSNKTIDGIGIVKGEYEWRDEFSYYKRCRNVEWLVKNIREDIYELNNQTVMTLSTVYQLKNISVEKVISVLKKYNAANNQEIIQKNNQPYVLIIDEINRGNVSKIFGELITLLEKDKRLGEENEITVTLPYSQEPFNVPSNLYIIGTMNTADRSIGHIDYAIRRRFAFVSIKADRKVIEENAQYKEDTKQKALDLFYSIQKFISEKINEDLDAEDLMVGHSYFLCETATDLKMRLEYEIIPLIEEYEKDGIIMVEKQTLKDKIKEWTGMIS